MLKISAKNEIPSKLYEKVLGPYYNSMGRLIVTVKDNGKYRTISYPKYKMEEHLGRRLDPNSETIDHINSNKEDNDINNLRIVPRAEHSYWDTRRVRLIDLTCDMCGEHFQRSPRLIRVKSKLGKRGYFCSRRCSGRYGRLLSLKQIKKQKKQQHVESEYYKMKYEDGSPPLIPTIQEPEEVLLVVEEDSIPETESF